MAATMDGGGVGLEPAVQTMRAVFTRDPRGLDVEPSMFDSEEAEIADMLATLAEWEEKLPPEELSLILEPLNAWIERDNAMLEQQILQDEEAREKEQREHLVEEQRFAEELEAIARSAWTRNRNAPRPARRHTWKMMDDAMQCCAFAVHLVTHDVNSSGRYWDPQDLHKVAKAWAEKIPFKERQIYLTLR
jgi:hypothetical protein